MPAHIYYRVGRYKNSLAANIAAMKADEEYFTKNDADEIYRFGYYPHNVHFALVSAQMSGDGETAITAAEKLSEVVSDAIAHEVGWVQAIKAAPYFAQAQFGEPDKVLALPAPLEFPFVTASWYYARALARIGNGDLSGAYAARRRPS